MTQLSSRQSTTNYNPTACLMARSYLQLNSSNETGVLAAQRGSLETERDVRERVAGVWLRRGEARGDEGGWAAGACWPRPSPRAGRFRRALGRFGDQRQTVPPAPVPGEAAVGPGPLYLKRTGEALNSHGPAARASRTLRKGWGRPGPEGAGR
ncbi:uncharacterized protein LOC134759588 [Pongo abelii]|uniref:uncharacterized protein LOC134759588 n=1 Tax=Pongo abelii TaxID=9601 RepID=UPI0001D5D79A